MRYTERMKKQNSSERKIYPYRFSAVIFTLFIVGLLLCAVGIGLSVWRFRSFLAEEEKTVYGWLQYIILFLMSFLFILLVLSMLVRSRYEITDKYLIMQFGIIRSKYEIKKIYSVHLFRGSNKLAVYFDDYHSDYTVIVVNPAWYEDFVRALIDKKPSIAFSFSTAEEEWEYKHTKK